MKLIHSEKYRDYTIEIKARYIENYFDWTEHDTNAVQFHYNATTPHGTDFFIDSFQYSTVPKKKPYKILFWKIKPKTTFEEDVRSELNNLIDYIKEEIDTNLFEKEKTDGLLDSLKEVN